MASFEVIREPSARYWYTWTPALIRAAEIAANSGNLRLAADLCEWMFGDDRLMAVLDTRSDALLGLPFELCPQGDGRQSGRAASMLRDDWDECYPEPEIKKLHAWGIVLGVGLARNVWVENEAGRLVSHLEVWSPRWLSWNWEEHTWMVEVAGADGIVYGTSKIPITPGDGEWIVYTPSGASRPWVHGAYRALARWCLLKQYAQQDLGFYSERLGQGVWVAETAAVPGVGTGTKEQRKELAADIQGLGRNSGIALQPGQSLRLVESVARSQESFKLQVDLADNGTAVAILGQNLTTQAGTGGTIGAASQHGKTQHGRTRMDGKTIPNCLRSQSITFWAEYNLGDRTLAPKPWWDTTPIDDANAKATVEQLTAIADGSLVNAGVMTVNEARAKRGLRPLPGGDVLRNGAPPTQVATDAAPAPSGASVANPTQQSVNDNDDGSIDVDLEDAAE
jgi:phage gp29-like protein